MNTLASCLVDSTLVNNYIKYNINFNDDSIERKIN